MCQKQIPSMGLVTQIPSANVNGYLLVMIKHWHLKSYVLGLILYFTTKISGHFAFLNLFGFMCMCVLLCVHAHHVRTGAHRGQKRAPGPLELESVAVVSHHMEALDGRN